MQKIAFCVKHFNLHFVTARFFLLFLFWDSSFLLNVWQISFAQLNSYITINNADIYVCQNLCLYLPSVSLLNLFAKNMQWIQSNERVLINIFFKILKSLNNCLPLLYINCFVKPLSSMKMSKLVHAILKEYSNSLKQYICKIVCRGERKTVFQ